MRIQTILILIFVSAAIRLVPAPKVRRWLMLGASILFLFWLQPALPIRYLDFFLPMAIIVIGLMGWLLLTPHHQRWQKINIYTFLFVLIMLLLIAVTRYFSVLGIITASRPPSIFLILVPIILITAIILPIRGRFQGKTGMVTGSILFLFVVLFLIKSPFLSEQVSYLLRLVTGQSVDRANSFDIRWLGFSYLVFRLVHTLLDKKNKRLEEVNLQEYLLYLIFFPAISAGPIDRIQRFLEDIRTRPKNSTGQDFAIGAWRLLIGIFKKFALADTLAIISLNATNAGQVSSTGWMWFLLYAYAFQILFDFSGYTDIAIGLGKLLGVNLPENFNKPYLKRNLKLFWDHWHMTLTQWFRTYYFNPISRKLRRQYKELPTWVMVLAMQLSTMILIGLWHGVTWNFIFWGLWHGVGLFLQNRWTDWLDPKIAKSFKPVMIRVQQTMGMIFTFHYVALGWVFFVLPSTTQALDVFKILSGI